MTDISTDGLTGGLTDVFACNKQAELLRLIGSTLSKILDSMDADELLPTIEPNSANELSRHITMVAEKAKQKLLMEMKAYAAL